MELWESVKNLERILRGKRPILVLGSVGRYYRAWDEYRDYDPLIVVSSRPVSLDLGLEVIRIPEKETLIEDLVNKLGVDAVAVIPPLRTVDRRTRDTWITTAERWLLDDGAWLYDHDGTFYLWGDHGRPADPPIQRRLSKILFS